MEVNALAIDLGSTACKACVVGIDGSVLGAGLVTIATHFEPGGVATQNAEHVWSAVVTACRSALGQAGAEATAAVGVVGIATHWSSLVPVDHQGMPVGPLLMWMDGRGRELVESVASMPGNSERWEDVHGFVPSAASSLRHLLWMQSQPLLHARAAAYVEPMDYLAARMTGVVAASSNSVMPFGLSDNRQLGQVAWSDELIETAQVDPSRLPVLAPSLGVRGAVTAESAALLGIAPTVVVVAGANDSIAACFGAGALEPGHAVVMIGTTGVVATHQLHRHVNNERFIVTMPSALDDRYYVVAEAGLAGKLVELAVAGTLGGDSVESGAGFEPLLAAAAGSTPGSGGVMFLPWAAGSGAPAPDRRQRGGLLGLSPSTTSADVARAVLEGIAMQLRWLVDSVDAIGEQTIHTVRFVGGGAQSSLWAAVLADTLGRSVDQLATPRHAIARGAALMAFVGSGHLTLDDVTAGVPVAERHEPDTDNAALFTDRLGVFQDLHRLLAEPVARLRPGPRRLPTTRRMT